MITASLINLCEWNEWNFEEEDLGSDHLCIKFTIVYNDKVEKNLKY
jgi:hypothetical protein